MSSDDNHSWAHVTFVHVPFLPPRLLILAFQPVLFHTIVTEEHYMLCSTEELFKKCRAELFDCGVANDMSKVTRMLVCIVMTPCFWFASLVCFGSFKNWILSGFAREWCRFPSRRLPYTSICLSNEYFFLRLMFAFIPLWLSSVSDILTPHDSNKDSHALSLLTILCDVYAIV